MMCYGYGYGYGYVQQRLMFVNIDLLSYSVFEEAFSLGLGGTVWN